MSKAGERMIAAMHDAVAVAKGEEPAGAIWHNGHRYVPEARATAAEARVTELEAGLREIADQELYNVALDTEWPRRIARALLEDVATALAGDAAPAGRETEQPIQRPEV